MKKTPLILVLLVASAGLALAAPQEKSKAPDNPNSSDKAKAEGKPESPIPLRVQVIFTEHEGEKKIVSLPYAFSVNADERRARPSTLIRDGVRLPVPTTKDATQYQYLDIGTNIDCWAQSEADGRFKLILSVERSSVSQEVPASSLPIVRQFRTEMNPILKDGQTFETVMATDPVNGHIYRVTVTLNVPKSN